MDKPNAGKWIVSFFSIVLVALSLLSAIAYIVDPFFQFRVRDNSYKLSEWFVSSGLIENYDYDTLIIGSSMIQNFDMNVFRNELGAKPLHIGLSGIRLPEIAQLMNLAYDVNKSENYYICVDLSVFTRDDTESRYPEYLLKKDILSRFRYLLSYEVWFRYIPVDVGFVLLDLMKVNLPEKFAYNKSVDRLGDWRLDHKFGKDIVLDVDGVHDIRTVDLKFRK